MLEKRHKTRKVKITESLNIGGIHPIVIESMTNADAHSSEKIISQINDLAQAGCQFVRISLPDMDAVKIIPQIIKDTSIPIMGDIHFDHKIALEAINNGIHSIRLNPGNIRKKEDIDQVISELKKHNIPVRIGANAGSINKNKFSGSVSDALVEGAMEHVKIFEEAGYENIIVSLKSSDVNITVDAYEKFASLRDYPLHIGITEAGTKMTGLIKSSTGIGILLYKGLGDTIRVSLTGDPLEEIYAAQRILKSLGLLKDIIEIISCPTCARTKDFDVEKIAGILEEKTRHIRKNIKVAIMGCIVNGPGEARDADIGVAGNGKEIMLIKKGKQIKTLKESEIIPEIMEFINKSDC